MVSRWCPDFPIRLCSDRVPMVLRWCPDWHVGPRRGFPHPQPPYRPLAGLIGTLISGPSFSFFRSWQRGLSSTEKNVQSAPAESRKKPRPRARPRGILAGKNRRKNQTKTLKNNVFVWFFRWVFQSKCPPGQVQRDPPKEGKKREKSAKSEIPTVLKLTPSS